MTTISIPYKKNEIEESLVALYLRLNGYFTSGFVIHSPKKGANKSEVDILASRFPLSREPEREVGTCPVLSAPIGLVDFIIGEVKNKKEEPIFNSPMFDAQNIEYQLRWVGVFTNEEVEIVAAELLEQLKTKIDGFPTVQWPKPEEENHITAKYQVRMILFDLNLDHKDDKRCISGNAVINHIWNCLRTDRRPPDCNRRYNYDAWGPIYSPIVKYFKDNRRKKQPASVDDLINWLSGISTESVSAAEARVAKAEA
ncbi:MAG: hypothetical protein HGB11_06855 [Chlorobiales bacterium]|nr:hypothetical protein [Chlorobiales bacterium]